MSLLADCHIHVYPEQDGAATIRSALSHLRTHSKSDQDCFAIFLTEAHSCNWFAALKSGAVLLPDDMQVIPSPEDNCLQVNTKEGTLFIFAGRQIVSAERLEILALTQSTVPKDGASTSDIIEAVSSCGAVPVLSWAPGKWMFARSKIVKKLIAESEVPLLLGDSALRCQGWPMPAVMKETVFPLLAGSDPLPVSGEEQVAGRYGVRIEMTLDLQAPVTSVREALLNPKTPVHFIGKRGGPLNMFSRMNAHRKNKKAGTPS
ncbi:hypothetical protein P3T73_05970 [Kiritimatiellota bacterium B12222]|nr:hypothetical protein P3T73_05970 [Kiritimatiellota bacterium B12222]